MCAKEWGGRPESGQLHRAGSGVRTDLAKPLVKMVEKSGNYPNLLKRVGEPREIAGIALYLASPAGAYATRQTFALGGGEIIYAPLDNQYSSRRISALRGSKDLVERNTSMGRLDGKSQ